MTAYDEWGNVYGTWQSNPRRGEGSRPRFDWMGADRDGNRYGDRDINGKGAPDVPPFGMTAGELYRYQRAFTRAAAERLMTVGKEQYDRGGEQKFESMTIDELLIGMREELADIVNYATMLDILIGRRINGRG